MTKEVKNFNKRENIPKNCQKSKEKFQKLEKNVKNLGNMPKI
jgi:hypothetical protein